MSEIDIIPLRAADRAAWLPLWRGYQIFYKTDIPDAVTTVTWKRLTDPTEPMGGALAWADGVAVGLVHHIQHRSCWTIGDYCYLQDLFVASDARGGGIGRALIEGVYAAARAAGSTRVYWQTHTSNAAGRLLYDKLAAHL